MIIARKIKFPITVEFTNFAKLTSFPNINEIMTIKIKQSMMAIENYFYTKYARLITIYSHLSALPACILFFIFAKISSRLSLSLTFIMTSSSPFGVRGRK